MTITRHGRLVPGLAALFMAALLAGAPAPSEAQEPGQTPGQATQAQAVRIGDISISNVKGSPTPKGADLAHVSLDLSNTGATGDILWAVEVDPAIAKAAGIDALPLRVYRGAGLLRSRPVYLEAGQTKQLGFDDVHLVIYGIGGPFTDGFRFPLRLVFQKAGAVDVMVHVGEIPAGAPLQPSPPRLPEQRPAEPGLLPIRFQQRQPMVAPPRRTGSEFGCDDGSSLHLTFGTRGTDLVATVIVKGESYVLPLQPWDGSSPRVVWSDAKSSLTWTSGVSLMWMSGPTHLMCGRSGGHHH